MGRVLSRSSARKVYSKTQTEQLLLQAGVRLLGGSRDEHPRAYRCVESVLKAHGSIARAVGAFHPLLVRMAGDGEVAEDSWTPYGPQGPRRR
ncbi:MAG: hypothetical protein AMXMBFR33_52450 [Candidatus Xenobia bacterium]